MRFLMSVLIISVFFVSSTLHACNYSAMIRSFNRAVAAFTANPTPARADRICRIIKRINDKFGNTPPKITPTPPAGVTCMAFPETGSGRGGGPGGLIIGVGHGGTGHGWVRNPRELPCAYTWEIAPDPLNPPGFDIFPLSGSIQVPGHTSLPVPFDIGIDPLVPPNSVGLFHISWLDTCTGLPLPDDSGFFQVFADPEISLLPASPFLLAEPGLPLDVHFEITNHTAAPVTRTFDFMHLGDPASVMHLNNGDPFDALNLFPTDKSVSSLAVTVDPLTTDLLLKDTLLTGEICDPAMINCCGLRWGDSFCCSQIFNHDEGPQRIAPLYFELVGQPTGVGDFGFQVGAVQVQVPTNAAPTVPDLLDILAQQTIDNALTINQFNFIPLVDEQGFMLMAPLDLPVFFFSNDPGMQWALSPVPLLPLLPTWPLPPALSGGLELMLQSLVPTVNGWTPPSFPE